MVPYADLPTCLVLTLAYIILLRLVDSAAACTNFEVSEDNAALEFVSDNFVASPKDIEEVEEGFKKLNMKIFPSENKSDDKGYFLKS